MEEGMGSSQTPELNLDEEKPKATSNELAVTPTAPKEEETPMDTPANAAIVADKVTENVEAPASAALTVPTAVTTTAAAAAAPLA